ncbi:MAG: DUF2800 domain-containing protein [Verrucomicrobiae bacterium]
MTRSTTSASNIFRREACPGSHAAEEQFPQEEDSEYSAEGTTLHELAANPDMDRSGLKQEQRDVLSRAETGAERILKAANASLKISENEPFEEGHEKEMWLRRGLKNLYPGHCDRWRYYPTRKALVIIDHKFGYIKVEEAESNLQLRSYAVMGAAKWDCDTILVAINQPRLPFDDRLTIAEYDRETIKAAKEHLLSVWDACHEENAPRVADAENQCRYCKARLHCDAYRAKYEWMSSIPTSQAKIFTERLQELCQADFDTVFQACQFAGQVFDAVKAEGRRRVEAGELPMFQLGKEIPDARISDVPKAWELLKAAGLPDRDIMASEKLSLTELAERFRDRDGLTVKDAKTKTRDTLADVITVTMKARTLTRNPDWKASAPAIENGSDSELFPK